MNWKYKAILQMALSKIPLGHHANYLFQKYVAKSFPRSYQSFVTYADYTKTNIFDLFNKFSHKPIDQSSFYEFGAGWDLITPLLLWSYGVNHQIIVDIRDLIKQELVEDTICKLSNLESNELMPVRKPHLPTKNNLSILSYLLTYYGIDYRAPCDARDTKLPAQSIDCITATNVLEHIPPQDILSILKECHRILDNDGLIIFRIDYQDHYSYFDKTISVYNFLKYPEKVWNYLNPDLHYQNRLRHIDYLSLFDEAAFSIIYEQKVDGTIDDLALLKAMPIDNKFNAYSLSDLAIRYSLFVLRKQSHVT